MDNRYHFRLRQGRDDDLIQWLESLGEGERSHFIRQTLRRGLNAGRGGAFERVESVSSSPAPTFNPVKVEEEARKVSREEAEVKLDGLLNTF